MTIEKLVNRFLLDNTMTLKNALVYGGLGLSETTGKVNEIVMDVAFNGHAYNEDRKRLVCEQLGAMMFNWHIVASTLDISPNDITHQYISEYLVKNDQMPKELQASILELMKHVKTDMKAQKLQNKKTRNREHHQV